MLNFKIDVSADSLEFLKGELTRTLKHVKSSHRCEALARGLGFRTYAAALSATKAETPIAARIRGDLFSAYLKSYDFDERPEVLYHVAARLALRDVSERTHRLTVWGIGSGRPQRKSGGSFENYQEHYARFLEYRAELVCDNAVEPFLASLAFLARVTPTKTIRQGTGSYWLKHIAENFECTYPEGGQLGPTYVPNGVFIAAALHAGFKMKTYVDQKGYDDLNVSFNMSKPCLVNLDCEIRPDGDHARDRRFREEMKQSRRDPYRSVAFW